MYSEEFDNDMSYNDEQFVEDDYQQAEQKPSFWNENKGLIIKIIIIVLCVFILFWLILKLKGNDNESNNPQNNMIVYAENVDKLRLAAEKYFFIDGNMPKGNEELVVTLDELVAKGYITEITDANKNVCDGANSNVTLVRGEQSYVLTINLVCSNTSNPQVYNYSLEKNACLDCSGFTYMDGTTNNENTEENNSDNNTDNNDEEEIYSCQVWSDWTDEKLNDDTLEVRTRVVVKGFKQGEPTEKITYGEWSEYTTEKIEKTADIDVDDTTKIEKVWVSKTSSKEVKESSTIRNVVKKTTSFSKCPDGYDKEDGKCVKETEKTGDLTYVQYNTYNVKDKTENKPCGGIKYENGETIYLNCTYIIKETTNLRWYTTTTYTYEELEIKQYYRSRSKKTEIVYSEPIITDEYYEEKDLPEGYEKVEGSEKTQYSYKLKECEK